MSNETEAAVISHIPLGGLMKGKHALISSVGCKNKKHKFGAKLTFAPNPAQPPKPSATGTSTATCKK